MNNHNNHNNNNTNHAAWGAVSSVTTMYGMFYYADAFSMQLCWDTSGKTTTNMYAASDGASTSDYPCTTTMQFKVNKWCQDQTGAAALYGNISSWNTSDVTDMSYLFSDHYCTTFDSFNEDISSWDVSRVTNMEYLFNGASDFDQDLSRWVTSRVTNINFIFAEASSFNQSFCWDTSSVTEYEGALAGCSGTYNDCICEL